MTFEIVRLQIFRDQIQSSSQIDGKRTLGITAAHENHTSSAGMLALQKHRIYSILLLVALEKQAKFIVSDFTYEAGRHSENGSTSDGIRRTATGYILDAKRFERLPDLVSGLHVHVLHTAFRQMVCL